MPACLVVAVCINPQPLNFNLQVTKLNRASNERVSERMSRESAEKQRVRAVLYGPGAPSSFFLDCVCSVFRRLFSWLFCPLLAAARLRHGCCVSTLTTVFG